MQSVAEHGRAAQTVRTRELVLDVDDLDLPGTLSVPEHACGLVVFAHGGGSNPENARNIELALALQRAGIATLLLDLLTGPEAADPDARFDVELLARRLLATVRWAASEALPRPAPLGYLGANTGAAAALIAAAEAPELVSALVLRGGWVNLAERWLPRVRTPALFIVGENDGAVLRFNAEAAAHVRARRAMSVIIGAGHQFAEPGALDRVARLATDWFDDCFRRRARLA
jgi:putative phosphoribosyl transferase